MYILYVLRTYIQVKGLEKEKKEQQNLYICDPKKKETKYCTSTYIQITLTPWGNKVKVNYIDWRKLTPPTK